MGIPLEAAALKLRAHRVARELLELDKWTEAEQVSRCMAGMMDAFRKPHESPRIAEKMRTANMATLKEVLDSVS